MSLLAAIRKLWDSIAPCTHGDVEEEFRSTLDAYREDLIRQGLPEDEAAAELTSASAGPLRKTNTTAMPSASASSMSWEETSATASAPCAATLGSLP